MKRLCILRNAQLCVLTVLFLFPLCPVSPQTGTETPYLLPQTIFVGDPGRLVVPLGQVYAGVEPFVLENSAPVTPDLVIRRIELEHRTGTSRLLIDFIPYAPGLLSFPSVEFPGTELPALTGLEAQVASILDPASMTLSEPAPPMVVPGTSFLVYGTLFLVLVVLALGIGGSLWSRRHLGEIWEKLRRRHLLRLMVKFLRRLGQEGAIGKNGNPNYYLTLLSGEFREFLSDFTGVNCRSLSAGEFLELPLTEDRQQWSGNPAFLCRLFRDWDTLRFSGRAVDKDDLFQALNTTEGFIIALDKAERSHERRDKRPVMEGV